jgi:hypothetical protein
MEQSTAIYLTYSMEQSPPREDNCRTAIQ